MEYKIRANIVMSRDLTVEAGNLKEAIEKVKDLMAKPFPSNELTPRLVMGTDSWVCPIHRPQIS